MRVVTVSGTPHHVVGRADHRQLPNQVECRIDIGEVLVHVHRHRTVTSSREHRHVPLAVDAEPVELDSPSRVRTRHLHAEIL